MIKIDKEKCIGCGACAAVASEIFKMEDDGLAGTIKTELTEEEKQKAIETSETCPTQAIEVE